MSNNNRSLDGKLRKCLVKQPSLLLGCPFAISRSRAVPKSGPVEGEDAVARAQAIDETSSLEIFSGGAVAMEEDNRRPFASFEVMQSNARNLDEFAACGVSSFRTLSLSAVEERQSAKNG
jgi:hypothetical protein